MVYGHEAVMECTATDVKVGDELAVLHPEADQYVPFVVGF
jgi:hypothetical protein